MKCDACLGMVSLIRWSVISKVVVKTVVRTGEELVHAPLMVYYYVGIRRNLTKIVVV